MKNVLIYGVYDFDNLGDDYMVAVIDEYLKSKKINPIYINNSTINNYFNLAIKREFELPFNKKYKNKIIKLFEIMKWYFHKNNIKNIDSLIFMGGGYTSESFGTRNLLNLLLLCKKFKSKKIFFTGQTVGPVYKRLNMYLIKKIYKSGSAIFVRETKSQKFLASLGIKSKLVGDDAFLTNYCVKRDKAKDYIVYNYKDFKTYENYKKEYFKILLRFAKEKKMKVLVIPFRSSKGADEYKCNYELYTFLKSNGINTEFVVEKSINNFQEILSNSKIVIGTAYHSIVLGLIFNNKVFSYYNGKYYKQKIEGILDWFNLSKTNCEPMNNILSSYNKMCSSIEELDIKSNEKIVKNIHTNVTKTWDYIIKCIIENK